MLSYFYWKKSALYLLQLLQKDIINYKEGNTNLIGLTFAPENNKVSMEKSALVQICSGEHSIYDYKNPVRISPDNLKDSIVELRYDSKIPFEILLGFIYKSLDDTYRYTNRPITKQQNRNVITGGAFQIELQDGQKIFFNEKIKLELRPNSFIFNCLDTYIGWSEYLFEIKKTLSQIFKIIEIGEVKRIGMRYISEYVNEGIDSNTRFKFSFGIPQIKSDTYLFRTEFNWENGEKVILNLQHNAATIIPKNNSYEKSPELVSIIDIDVISDNLDVVGLSNIFDEITRVHKIEKEVFFSILNPEYLNSLNPVYE